MKSTIISIEAQTLSEKIAEFEPDLIVMSEPTFCLLKETQIAGLYIDSTNVNKFQETTILFNTALPLGEFKLYKEIGQD